MGSLQSMPSIVGWIWGRSPARSAACCGHNRHRVERRRSDGHHQRGSGRLPGLRVRPTVPQPRRPGRVRRRPAGDGARQPRIRRPHVLRRGHHCQRCGPAALPFARDRLPPGCTRYVESAPTGHRAAGRRRGLPLRGPRLHEPVVVRSRPVEVLGENPPAEHPPRGCAHDLTDPQAPWQIGSLTADSSGLHRIRASGPSDLRLGAAARVHRLRLRHDQRGRPIRSCVSGLSWAPRITWPAPGLASAAPLQRARRDRCRRLPRRLLAWPRGHGVRRLRPRPARAADLSATGPRPSAAARRQRSRCRMGPPEPSSTGPSATAAPTRPPTPILRRACPRQPR
jgi:hypothetical protein